MKLKNTLILLVVFVALLLIVLFVINPFGWYEKEDGIVLFEGFNPNDVVKIWVKTPEGEAELIEKKNGDWKVATYDYYPADSKEVDALLSRVKGFKRENIISKNPEKRSVFQVDESGIEVKVFGKGERVLAHFFVGKGGPDLVTTYVRRADSDEVVTAEGLLKYTFDKGEKTWRDRTIFDFDPETAIGIELEGPDGTISLSKDESSNWRITDPEEAPAKKSVVNTILKTFSSLEADTFADEGGAGDYELDDPKTVITVSLEGGSKRVLLVGKEGEKSRDYIKRADKDTIFLLSKYRIEYMMKKLDELKEEEKEEEEKKE